MNDQGFQERFERLVEELQRLLEDEARLRGLGVDWRARLRELLRDAGVRPRR